MRHLIALAITSIIILVTLGTPASARTPAPAGCVEQVAAWSGIHPTLLRAIAWVESRGDHLAFNRNKNGTYDVGLMQINSFWHRRGIGPWWEALGHPCVNLAAGAWVLRQCVGDHGYTWGAVGCYNAGSNWTKGAKRRAAEAYVRKVQAALGIGPGPPRRR
jgi:soluble lytic murein transglycosylase-like protein